MTDIIRPTSTGDVIVLVESQPVEAFYGLSDVVLQRQWQNADPVVRDAVLKLDSAFDDARCATCGNMVGGYLAIVGDSDVARWDVTVLVIQSPDDVTRYCEDCADEAGLLPDGGAE